MALSQNALFDRRYCVTLTSGVDTKVACYGNSPPANTGGVLGSLPTLGTTAQLTPTPLRVAFDVVKNSKDSPNKGSVEITNMAPSTRNSLRPGLTCQLEVGYRGAMQILFKATVVLVKTERHVADIVTKLELMDGNAATSLIPFDKTYNRNTPKKKVIMDCVQLLRVPTPVTPDGITTGAMVNLPEDVYSQGYTAHGSVYNTLSEICRTAGLEWSIQDGVIQICPLTTYIEDSGEMLAVNTGMIGVPSYDGQILTVSSLMNPRLTPGRLVAVQSRDGISGTFKIRGGHWQGDSHGDQWTCELECIPMGSTGVKLANTVGNSLKNLVTTAKAAEVAAQKAAKHKVKQ